MNIKNKRHKTSKLKCEIKKPKEEFMHTMLQEEKYYVFSDCPKYVFGDEINSKRLV